VLEPGAARGDAVDWPAIPVVAWRRGAYDEAGDFRASIYLRPLAIWAIEEALRRQRGG
jgi:hypothetical protein